MKKIIFVALFLVALSITPALAQTSTSNESLIASLRAQIATLTAQLNQLLAQQKQDSWCWDFTGKGDETDQLVKALEMSGFFLPLPSQSIDGETIPLSMLLTHPVKQFQTKYSIPSTGYVGPLTRAKLNSLYGCKKSPVNNQAPIISGISGPTSLKVGETGTWTIKASDPNNSSLNYYILYGDEARTIGSSSNNRGASPMPVPLQTTTFSHSYNLTGTYYLEITATNSLGKSATASISVNVVR